MTQTGAIFLDAYRSLNAKRMFWIVLVLSGLVVVAFAFMGINERGMTIAFWQFDSQFLNSQNISPALLYKWLFVSIGISVWLSWIATILALVSTAGMFPDLINGGSIALLVSKPIGRLRLFATQYAAGLLFVTLQVTIFSLVSFLVIGLRGGVWEPGLFIAVPLVVCFFSYLFSICVLLGLLTRSTLAALLLTLLFWFMVWGLGVSENTLLLFRTMGEQGVTMQDIQQVQEASRKAEKPSENETEPDAAPGPTSEKAASPEKEDTGEETEAKEAPRSLVLAHNIVYGVKTVLPKTSETIDLLERSLISMAELPEQPDQDERQARLGREMVETIRSRSVAWVVGTSLGFELVVLCWAALIFCRRDF
jgi:ABC-type transport system involved in multi-copper enzyme maturation permease subunit